MNSVIKKKYIKFIVCNENAPPDSTAELQNDVWVNKKIDIYKNGKLQQPDYDIIYDSTDGTISFFPDIVCGDTIFMNIDTLANWEEYQYVWEPPPAPGDYLTINLISGGSVTESPAHTFTSSGSTVPVIVPSTVISPCEVLTLPLTFPVIFIS